MISEPVTVLTDYLLAAVSFTVAWMRRGETVPARRLWAAAFVATGLAAVVGGTEHAVRPRLGVAAGHLFFVVTYVTVGIANALLLAGAARVAFAGRARALALGLVALRFAAFAALMLAVPSFTYVIADLGVTLALVGALAVAGMLRAAPWALPVGMAVLVSVAGALVQGLHLAPHEHFNHNDLFHVIQAVGMVLFHAGARRLDEAQLAGTMR